MVDIVDGNLLDIGYGMPVQISSVLGGGAPPSHLVPASAPANPFFRTDVEDSPSLTIDLLSVRHVHRIRVFNDEVEYQLALPLIVSTSTDGLEWIDVTTMRAHFGGKVTNTPLTILFKYYTLCRFIRLQTWSRTRLQLHYVEICGLLPHEYLGRLRNIRITPSGILADYWHHDSYGFSWTFTCSLSMIFSARLIGITIDQVNYRLCLAGFKDDAEEDLYKWLFEPRPRGPDDQPEQHPAFEPHGVYVSHPLGILRAYADLYFRPHARVLAFANSLIEKYRVDLGKTIVLLYRGTDKSIELAPASPESYVAVARSLMSQEDGLRVILQTDQAQARDAMAAELPDAIWFDELPVTGGNLAIHNLDVPGEFGIAKPDLALRLLAMTYLVGHAKYVVTHTGNLAAWVAIYRGKPDGVYQFCEDGKLRGPTGDILTPDVNPPISSPDRSTPPLPQAP